MMWGMNFYKIKLQTKPVSNLKNNIIITLLKSHIF